MTAYKGQIMSRKAFLGDGLYSKEEYEGLIASSDLKQGCYNIGVEIGNDRILIVDQVDAKDVNSKLVTWSAEVPKIQAQYGARHELHN